MRNQRTPIPDQIEDSGVVDLIKRMWHEEPEKRPAFEQIVEELKILHYQLPGTPPSGNGHEADTDDMAWLTCNRCKINIQKDVP